jgi:ribosomal 30S subunit maturation factor RimM
VSAEERPTLEVGRIIKAQGLKGQVLVDLWSDRTERPTVDHCA